MHTLFHTVLTTVFCSLCHPHPCLQATRKHRCVLRRAGRCRVPWQPILRVLSSTHHLLCTHLFCTLCRPAQLLLMMIDDCWQTRRRERLSHTSLADLVHWWESSPRQPLNEYSGVQPL